MARRGASSAMCARAQERFYLRGPMGVAGQVGARSAVCVAVLAAEPGICRYGDFDAGAGGGREYGGVQRDECGAAAVAAGGGSGAAGVSANFESAAAGPGRSIRTRHFPIPFTKRCASRTGALTPVMAYVPLSGSKVAVRVRSAAGGSGRRHGERRFLLRAGREAAAGPRIHVSRTRRIMRRIAVISYNYWTRRFARDPDVLGKTLFVNGVAADDCGSGGAGI